MVKEDDSLKNIICIHRIIAGKTGSNTTNSIYDKLWSLKDKKGNFLIKRTHIDEKTIEFLKKYIGSRCNKILVEYPYSDRDYLSSVYVYYIKSNKLIDKSCYRLHLYNNNKYCGYIVLRPTPFSHIGRIQAVPSLFLESGTEAYLIKSKFKCNIMGEENIIRCFPFTKQDPVIAMCAQVATWEIIRFAHSRGWNYSDINLANISDSTLTFSERKIPAKGLMPNHIMEILNSVGLFPLMCGGIKNPDVNIGEVFAYIESGLPIIGLIPIDNHAICLIGHGKIEYPSEEENLIDYYEQFDDQTKNQCNIIMHHRFISSIIINDDNYAPYQEMPRRRRMDLSCNLNRSHISNRSIDSIETYIIPLNEKMYISYNIVYNKSMLYLRTAEKGKFPETMVVRIYLTASNSFKRESYKNIQDMVLRKTICSLNMASFIWCVEVSSIKNYTLGQVDGLLILDATRHINDEDPWILIQSLKSIEYYDGEGFKIRKYNNPIPYSQYKNNLEGV